MTLPWPVLVCGLLAVLVLGGLTVLFWRDPIDGMRQTTHRLECLPQVMTDRYAALAVLALALTLRGDLVLLAVFFGVCSFMGFADGRIYAQSGFPHTKHTLAGALSALGVAVTLAAIAMETA